MNPFRLATVFGIVFSLLVMIAVRPGEASVLKDDIAPDFSLRSLEGDEVTLNQFHGKYRLVNFWATWCGPCKMEMPSLEALHQKYKDHNLELLAISGDMFGAQIVRPYVENQGITFRILLDSTLNVSHRYGVVNLPTTFLIDPQGKVLGIHQGAEDWDSPEIFKFFDRLLKKSQSL